MTMPIHSPLTIYRGDTFRRSYVGVFSSLAPLDVGDWSAAAQIRRTADDADIVESVTVALSVEGVDDEDLRIDVSLTAAETAALSAVGRVWDLEVTGPLGTTTWVRGPVTVQKDVTRVDP